MELQAFDANLRMAGVVHFKSLIWIPRYNRVGACEVYAPATERNMKILINGNYLALNRWNQTYDHMTCQIVDVKIKENPDEGKYITAIGHDAKVYLDRRVNVSLMIFNATGNPGAALESFVWQMLNTGGERRLLKPNLSPLILRPTGASAVDGDVAQSVFGMSYGAMVRQICGSLSAGYHFLISDVEDGGGQPTQDGLPGFAFEVYRGEDVSDHVVFSRKNNNVGNINYEHDIRSLKNVCYIQNPDVRSLAAVLGSALWTERIESFLETSATPNMQYSQIREALEGTWTTMQNGDNVDLSVQELFVPVLSPWQLNRLLSWQPSGDTTTRDGYFHLSGPVVIGTAENTQAADVTDQTSFYLIPTMFDYVLLCEGVEFLSDKTEKETLDVEIIDNEFVYMRDYSLGDTVTVEAYGRVQKAQIVEIMECWDENGYHLEPRTEYTDAEQS